jgi:transposase
MELFLAACDDLSKNPSRNKSEEQDDTCWPPSLSDREWERLRPRFPRPPKKRRRRRDRKGGRPRLDDRRCFDAVIWLMATGAPLRRLPERLGKRSGVSLWIRRSGITLAGAWA